ncbi:hypothetical protein D3C87_1584470 [compost metagenome]
MGLGDGGQLGHARHVHRLDVLQPGLQHRALFQRHAARGGIGNHAISDAVQVGPAFFPVVLVLDQFDVGAALPALELERPRAHRRIVVRVLPDRRVHVVQVPGQDRAPADIERIQKRGVRLLQLEYDRLRIRRRDLLHVRHQRAGAGRVGEDLGVGEHHIVGRERLAIMPLHLRLQMEGVGQAIL